MMMVIREIPGWDSVFTTQLMRKTPAKNKTMAAWIAKGGHSVRVHWGMGVGSGYSMTEVYGGLRSARGTQYTSVQNMVAMTPHPRILYSVVRFIRLG